MRLRGAGARGRAGLLPFGRIVSPAELVLDHLVSARWAVDVSPEDHYRRGPRTALRRHGGEHDECRGTSSLSCCALVCHSIKVTLE
ncbi:hypothetical protein [Kibdelosporangium philippinense]|uniref:hypothetical protein n=1 Tax=Kibdelosporangium philippinense TaxID=211113 RepID=UPI0036196F54